MLTRRGFLQRLGAAAVALTLARHLPGIAPAPPDITEPAWTELRPGDVFTIEGRYAFNPVTRQPTEYLQKFIVTGDVSGDEVAFMPSDGQGFGVRSKWMQDA